VLGVPIGQTRVMSVVPPRYCAPESISSSPSATSPSGVEIQANDSGVAR
jgi:hypothetical protein